MQAEGINRYDQRETSSDETDGGDADKPGLRVAIATVQPACLPIQKDAANQQARINKVTRRPHEPLTAPL